MWRCMHAIFGLYTCPHTRSDFAHLSAARFPERVGSHTTASRREKRMAAPTEAALDSIRAVMRSGSIR